MFTERLTNTPFFSNMANGVFTSITQELDTEQNIDMTFISTLRALLMPRKPEGDSILFRTHHYTHSKSTLEDHEVDTLVKAVSDLGRGTISLTQFNRERESRNGGKEADEAWIDFVEAHFTEVFPEYQRIEKVTQFFYKAFKVLCFVNSEIKSVILFTRALSIKNFHYLQCGILAFLPWYFDKEKGISPVEMELIESLRGKDSKKYIDVLAKLVAEYNIRGEYTKKALAGFETRVERHECARVESEMADKMCTIDDLNRRISSILAERNELCIRLMGLKAKIAYDEENGVDSEIADYISRNGRIFVENVDDFAFTFVVKDYLEFWDEEMAKGMIQNRRSYAFNPIPDMRTKPFSDEDEEELLKAIFLDNKFKIRTCAAYRFDIHSMRVSAIGGYGYGYEFNDCIPNTHIDSYSCLGNYTSAINEFLKRNDYVGAIEQCLASCRSLNFADSPVMCEFFRGWYGICDANRNNRCIELPNGDVVTPADAIKYMKSENGVDEQVESEES